MAKKRSRDADEQQADAAGDDHDEKMHEDESSDDEVCNASFTL